MSQAKKTATLPRRRLFPALSNWSDQSRSRFITLSQAP